MARHVHYYDAEELAMLEGVDAQMAALGPHSMAHLQSVYGSLGAAEPIEFNASAVWADVQAGGACYTPGTQAYIAIQVGKANGDTAFVNAKYGECNFRGGRATQKIREGLNVLGYGPLPYGVPWSEGNPGAAWKHFLADNNMAPGPGLGVTLLGLQQMQAKLQGDDDVVPIPPGKDETDKPVISKKWLPWAIAGGALVVVGGGYYLMQK